MKVTDKIELSDKQLKILDLLSKDFTSKKVAVIMSLSLSSIEKEIRDIKDYYFTETLCGTIFKHYQKTT